MNHHVVNVYEFFQTSQQRLQKKQSCFWKQLRFEDNHNVSSVGASKADLAQNDQSSQPCFSRK